DRRSAGRNRRGGRREYRRAGSRCYPPGTRCTAAPSGEYIVYGPSRSGPISAIEQATGEVNRARWQRLASPRDRPCQDEGLVRRRQARALGEHPWTDVTDLVEHAHSTVPHQRELDGEVGADDVDERPRALEQRPRARDL